MKTRVAFLLICFFLVGSCVPVPIAQNAPDKNPGVSETMTPRPTRTLFATFTASPKPPETATLSPTSTWTPTITPTATGTPTPTPSHTASPQGTHQPPTPAPPGASGCTVYADVEGLPIYPDPSINPFRVWPTLEPGVAYEAVSVQPVYNHIYRSGSSVGWVDYRLIGLRREGSGCGNLPRDERPLTAFSTICFFSPNEEIQAFLDTDLTDPHFIGIDEGELQVIVVKYENSLLAAVGHAMSYYVPREAGALTGACEDIPRGGRMSVDGELWSEPDGRKGEPVVSLTAGIRVYVQPVQIQGPGLDSDSVEITWIQVMAAVQVRPVGWVPATWVIFD